MKVRLLCVGKIKESFFTEGIQEYAKRLQRYCKFEISEVAECNVGEEKKRKQTEGEALLKQMQGKTILLDREGTQVDSVQFAELFRSEPEVTVVIGGSLGVSDEVKQKSDVSVAFGNVTYPHQLMRLIASEQIYRAFTILHHTPYHK